MYKFMNKTWHHALHHMHEVAPASMLEAAKMSLVTIVLVGMGLLAVFMVQAFLIEGA